VKSALRLVALDETAEKLGLRPGQALADARAMIPALAVADDDPAADHALLEGIADWAERYTPLVALDVPQEARRCAAPTGGQHGLMLDVTGSSHLFGGERTLLADLAARLSAQGFRANMAIADTPGAASAAARFGGGAVVPEGGATEMLRPLPLAALRLDHETVSALDRVGLKRIGQLIGASRGPLAARFGRILIRRLDQALGQEEEAINPRRPAPAMIAERRFAEPIAREEDIAATLSSLATTLSKSLEARGLGARHLELALFRVDGVVKRIAVGAGRPLRAPKLVLALFREKFAGLGETIDMGFGFDMARLAVIASAPVDPAQIDLSGNATAAADLDGLIDRIGARLGPEHVTRIVARESHIPERAEVHTMGEGGGRMDREIPPSSDPIDRPLRLFERPEPVEAIAEVPDGPPVRFRWRRVLYQVARAEGPERIAPEWWRDDALSRDYFRVEDLAGHRFWLYREGLYGRELAVPRWYLHGVFG
jgi:protein ImuB